MVRTSLTGPVSSVREAGTMGEGTWRIEVWPGGGDSEEQRVRPRWPVDSIWARAGSLVLSGHESVKSNNCLPPFRPVSERHGTRSHRWFGGLG